MNGLPLRRTACSRPSQSTNVLVREATMQEYGRSMVRFANHKFLAEKISIEKEAKVGVCSFFFYCHLRVWTVHSPSSFCHTWRHATVLPAERHALHKGSI